MSCKPLGDSINGYVVFDKATTVCMPEEVALPGVVFYGKSSNHQPLFAVMNYDMFRTAKTGMIAASVLAAGLGIVAIVLGVKLAQKGKMPIIQ